MITRFAPTPSGFLHVGNAVNALLVSWLARSSGGQVALRIDDTDATRIRPQYVDDIFDLLAWLGLDWQVGPRSAADFTAHWSARDRVPQHRAALQAATDDGLGVYACRCSRAQQPGPATGGCRGGCAQARLPWEAGRTALRLRVPLDTVVVVDATPIRLADDLGDFVVWRRDDLPAYQLASVLDDVDLAITDVVRGADLRASTAAQVHLAAAMGLGSFALIRFRHHDLVAAADGSKLSKSQHSRGGALPRTDATRAVIHEAATRLGAPLGIEPPTHG